MSERDGRLERLLQRSEDGNKAYKSGSEDCYFIEGRVDDAASAGPLSPPTSIDSRCSNSISEPQPTVI